MEGTNQMVLTRRRVMKFLMITEGIDNIVLLDIASMMTLGSLRMKHGATSAFNVPSLYCIFDLSYMLIMYMLFYPTLVWFVSPSSALTTMAPHGSNFRCSPTSQMCTMKDAIEAMDFHHQFVSQEDCDTMPSLEEEVIMVRAYKEVEEVEEQASENIIYLGCTRTRNSKFFRSLKI